MTNYFVMHYKILVVTLFCLSLRHSEEGAGFPVLQEEKKVYVLNLPSYITDGFVTIDSRNLRDSSTITFTIGFHPNSPHYLIDAGFFLDVSKRPVVLKTQESFRSITVYELMDSLKLKGRSFIRQNTFYSVLGGDKENELRTTRGEYIYKKFPDDDN